MARVVENHGKGRAVEPVHPQDADLGINRPDALHFVVRRTRIPVPNGPRFPVLQSKRAVHPDAVLVAYARTDLDLLHAFHSPTHRVEGSF